MCTVLIHNQHWPKIDTNIGNDQLITGSPPVRMSQLEGTLPSDCESDNDELSSIWPRVQVNNNHYYRGGPRISQMDGTTGDSIASEDWRGLNDSMSDRRVDYTRSSQPRMTFNNDVIGANDMLSRRVGSGDSSGGSGSNDSMIDGGSNDMIDIPRDSMIGGGSGGSDGSGSNDIDMINDPNQESIINGGSFGRYIPQVRTHGFSEAGVNMDVSNL